MNKLILIVTLFLASLTGFSQNKDSLCVRHYCVDTVYLPTNSISLVAYVKSGSKLVIHGWKELAGPSAVTIPGGDSVNITGLVAGTYSFQYNVTNLNGRFYSGIDNITVIPLPVKPRSVKSITTQFTATGPVTVITYDDGTTQ